MKAIPTFDPSTKWKDYPGDTLYLWNGDVLYAATEDAGCNLSKEDEAEGYKDSWVVNIYSLTEEVPQGGQWMETELISDLDYTIEGIMKRLGKCDLWKSDWQILEPDFGACIEAAILKLEKIAAEKREA